MYTLRVLFSALIRAGFSWWGAQLTWGHQVGDCKSLKIKNARHISRMKKKYEEFGGRPPVGGRPGARAPCPPLKSGTEYGSKMSHVNSVKLTEIVIHVLIHCVFIASPLMFMWHTECKHNILSL